MSFLDHLNIVTHKSIIGKILTMSWLKGLGATALVTYGTLFQNNNIIMAVYLLVLIDTTLGFAAAYRDRVVSSADFFRVLIKTIVYFSMILTGRLVDQVVPIAFASTIIESFLVMTEALSILENSSRLGVPIPMKLVRMLKQMGDHSSNSPSSDLNKKD